MMAFVGKLCDWHQDWTLRYQDWNRAKYLSDFERWLNRLLWALLAIALVYAVLQHVILANVPEAFRGGARLGTVCYDIAVAYIGAFTFYLLNVRLPLRRDRRNVYQYLARLIDRLVEEGVMLMQALNGAAHVEATRVNTLENVEDTCAKIGPRTTVMRTVVPTSTGPGSMLKPVIVTAIITESMNRTRQISREILSFSAYLASDLIKNIVAIDSCELFRNFAPVHQLASSGTLSNQDLSDWAKAIFDYLQLVDDVENYRRDNNIRISPRPSKLIFGTDRRSSVIPLGQRMTPLIPWDAARPDEI